MRGPATPGSAADGRNGTVRALVARSGDATDLDSVRLAVTRSADHLLVIQRPDGEWVGELEADCTLEADYIQLLCFLGDEDREKIARLARTIREEQLEDGSWHLYPGGQGNVSATVKAYLALRLAGDAPDAPHMRRGHEAILERGGLEAVNSYTRIYLALFGLFPWNRTVCVPPQLIYLPRYAFCNIYNMSSWTRAIIVPLSIVSALRPTRPVPFTLDELRLAAPPPSTDDEIFSWRGFFRGTDRLLKAVERRGLLPRREDAIRRCEQWTLERCEKSAGLAAIFPAMMNTVLALHALGYPREHPSFRRALAELEALEIAEDGAIRMQPCLSPVWDTAWVLRALVEAGVPAEERALQRSVRWLLDHEVREAGDWQVSNREAEPSGWYFEYANEWYPDVDDTAEVLMAIGRIPLVARDSDRAAAFGRGLAWMLSMQNRDGGWGAFDKNNDTRILTHIPFADHNAMIDPSTADVTARVTELLGELGAGLEDPVTGRALEFLEAQQCADGSWFGRWGVNYVYGTWQVLRGLRSIGLPAEHRLAAAGAAWLASVQNRDGGFGESCESYDHPERKGHGPSTPSQTAWGLMGLLSGGGLGTEAVERAVQWLLAHQKSDGSFEDSHFTGTGFPSVFYLKYHLYATYFPLLALSTYARLRERRPTTGLARLPADLFLAQATDLTRGRGSCASHSP